MKKYLPQIISLLLTTLVIGSGYNSGYLLMLDLPWTPTFPLNWDVNGINNVYPLYALLHYLTLIIPSDMVQKGLLTCILFSLFYIPYRYLPYIKSVGARVFAAGVFALNPFVYARLISGQWFHLFAYALLPLLLYTLKNICDEPNKKNTYSLTISLFLISLLSVHILYLAFIFSFVFICFHILKSVFEGEKVLTFQTFKSSAVSVFVFILISLWWLVPAILRDSATEARFDPVHYSAFAASSNGVIPVELNTLALGGFWSEGLAWNYYYVWPQQTILFWISALVIWTLALAGLLNLFKGKKTRSLAVLFLLISFLSYITSLGYADTIFKSFNLFLYTHIPLWSGLRDSNKIVSLLSLMYALLSGLGVSYVLEKLNIKKLTKENLKRDLFSFVLKCLVLIILFLTPITYGMYMWVGLGGQLKPVNYPADWYEAKILIDTLPKGEKVLVLPWHSYLSLPFNENRLVASPIPNFFGGEHVLTSRSVDFGAIHDQESDKSYRELDDFVSDATNMSYDELRAELEKRNITHLLIITSPDVPDSELGLTTWEQFSSIGLSKNDEENPNIEKEEIQKNWSEMLSDWKDLDFVEKSVQNTLILKKI
jgi:hypothetical protein